MSGIFNNERIREIDDCTLAEWQGGWRRKPPDHPTKTDPIIDRGIDTVSRMTSIASKYPRHNYNHHNDTNQPLFAVRYIADTDS